MKQQTEAKLTSHDWMNFHRELFGFKLFKTGREVPKFMVFWSGLTPDEIFSGKTKIEAK